MPTTETTNRRLLRIASGSTEDWSVHYNTTLDRLDGPVINYQIAAAEAFTAGEVAVIKDDGAGAKKAYLAASGAVTMGDPIGIATETVTAGSPVRLTLSGAVSDASYAFGPTDTTAYLSASGTVTQIDTGYPLGPVIGVDTFLMGASSGGGGGGQTNTVVGSSGLVNNGTNVDADLAPLYGATAGTVCEGNDVRLHTQNSDAGTSATSFEINYPGSSARLLTRNLTGSRDITFPDVTTQLLGSANNLSDVANVATARTNLALPGTLTANQFLRNNAAGTAVEGQTFPYAVASDATAPSIPTHAWTVLGTWSATVDPMGIVTVSGITPGVAGTYVVVGSIAYTTSSAGNSYYVAIYLNGTINSVASVSAAAAAVRESRWITSILSLSATDTVSLGAYQDSGSTKTLFSNATYNRVSVWRIA